MNAQLPVTRKLPAMILNEWMNKWLDELMKPVEGHGSAVMPLAPSVIVVTANKLNDTS